MTSVDLTGLASFTPMTAFQTAQQPSLTSASQLVHAKHSRLVQGSGAASPFLGMETHQ